MEPFSPALPYSSFLFNDTATTEIYTLSLHDALPISSPSAPKSATSPISITSVAIFRPLDRKSTRLNSSHITISYAVFCLKKQKKYPRPQKGFEKNRQAYHTEARRICT